MIPYTITGDEQKTLFRRPWADDEVGVTRQAYTTFRAYISQAPRYSIYAIDAMYVVLAGRYRDEPALENHPSKLGFVGGPVHTSEEFRCNRMPNLTYEVLMSQRSMDGVAPFARKTCDDGQVLGCPEPVKAGTYHRDETMIRVAFVIFIDRRPATNA